MCLARLNPAPDPLLSKQKEMTLLEVLQKPQLLVLCPLMREVVGWVVSQQMQQRLPAASSRSRCGRAREAAALPVAPAASSAAGRRGRPRRRQPQ